MHPEGLMQAISSILRATSSDLAQNLISALREPLKYPVTNAPIFSFVAEVKEKLKK